LDFNVSSFWLEIAILGQNMTFWGKYGSNVKIKYFNPQKAHPCVIPRILSRHASKSVKGFEFDLCACLRKQK